MIKHFSVLIFSIILMGSGCVSSSSVSTTPPSVHVPTASQSPEVPTQYEKSTTVIPTGWLTYHDFNDGFFVSYPGEKNVDLEKTQTLLPFAIGNKERKM